MTSTTSGWEGGPVRPAIALHARRLELLHPVRKEPISIVAEPPAFWRRLGVK